MTRKYFTPISLRAMESLSNSLTIQLNLLQTIINRESANSGNSFTEKCLLDLYNTMRDLEDLTNALQMATVAAASSQGRAEYFLQSHRKGV